MIVDDYIQLHEKYTKTHGSNTLILLEVGSFYEAYAYPTVGANGEQRLNGFDLHRIGSMCNIQVTRKNKQIAVVDVSNPYMMGFPNTSLKKYLRILVQNQVTVVVINQKKVGSKFVRSVAWQQISSKIC